jgi:hypothetical protein
MYHETALIALEFIDAARSSYMVCRVATNDKSSPTLLHPSQASQAQKWSKTSLRVGQDDLDLQVIKVSAYPAQNKMDGTGS